MRKSFDSVLKKVPLHIRIKVSNQATFLSILTDLGIRGEESWGEEEQELLEKIISLANKHTKDILKTFKEWEDDGRP